MFKFGICHPHDLTDNRLTGFFGRRRFVVITLYRHVSASDGPDRDAQLERILCRFPSCNGTWKRTYRSRFGMFDQEVANRIADSSSHFEQLTVHDMGVSNGITAAEFYRSLCVAIRQPVEYLASDFSPDVTLISAPNRRLTLV